MKTTEEETKQSPSEEGEAKEEVAKKEETSTLAEATTDKPASEDVKAEETKEEPTPNPSQEGNKEGKGGEDKKDQDTDTSASTSAEAMADKKATADKPAEKEEAKEEEDTPKKKRKSERQEEEAALIEEEGEAIEIKAEQKVKTDIKIQDGHISISTGKVELPDFASGDTITIHYKIREGSKERIQLFQGVVIQRRGSHTTETCTIRKVSGGIGVERIFPLHSPFIDKIIINKKGVVRRARIFYLRKLKGKKARIKEKK